MGKWGKIVGSVAVVAVALVVAGVAILGSMDFNQYKGMIAEQAKNATGRDLTIDGDLHLEISLNPAIAVDGVSFSNAEWGSRPDMLTVKRFAAEVSLIPLLSGQVVVNRLLIEGVDFLAETDAQGFGNWKLGGAGETESEASSSGETAALPSVDQVVMREIAITYKNGVTGAVHSVSLAEMTAAAGSVDAPVEIAAKGSVNEKEFSLSGMLGSVAQMADPNGVSPVDIKISMLGVDTTYKGKVGTPGGNVLIDGDVTMAVPSLTQTLIDAAAVVPDLAIPEIGADTINLSAKLKFDGKSAALSSMTLALGKTDIAGNITAALGGARPNVEAALSSNLIDLDELMPKSEEQTVTAPAAGPSDGRVFPKEPLPLDALKAADAKVAFDGKKIVVKGNAIEDVSVRLSLKSGNLQVDPMAATIVGTKVAGKLNLNASSTPKLAADISATGLDYGELLKQQGMTDIAEGKLDAKVNVAGSGSSVRQIMAGLNGDLFVKTENGRINSSALNIVSSDVMSVLPGFNSKDDKTLRCGVINFDIVKGIAKAKAIVVETGGLSAIGTGNVDLREERLGLLIDPRAKQTSLASAAIVPVKIKGTFLAPDWELDAAALAGNTASTVAKGAAALATGGLSLLLESAAKRATGAIDTTDYCTPALAGKAVVPGKMSETKAETSTGGSSSGGDSSAQPPAQKSGVEGAVEGVSKGLKSLFGN